MNNNQVKGTPLDDEVDMEEVEIVDSQENWNSYKLEDGTLLKVKVVAAKALKSTDQAASGTEDEPVYRIKHNVVVYSEISDQAKEELRENMGGD